MFQPLFSLTVDGSRTSANQLIWLNISFPIIYHAFSKRQVVVFSISSRELVLGSNFVQYMLPLEEILRRSSKPNLTMAIKSGKKPSTRKGPFRGQTCFFLLRFFNLSDFPGCLLFVGVWALI